MTISSRTPEGSPNDCPVCGALVRVEPSRPPGDAPCPSCGTLLWFVPTGGGAMLFDAATVDPLWDRFAEMIGRWYGIPKDRLDPSTSLVEDLAVDSLDIVEFVMEIEEGFGVPLPDAEAEKMRTLGDWMNYILRRRSE